MITPLDSGIDTRGRPRAHYARAHGPARDDLGQIIAGVEAIVSQRGTARQILAYLRAYAEEIGATPPATTGLVWIAADSPQGRAWAAWWVVNKSRHGPPRDQRGGWFFPSPWPPGDTP